jgi:hypothetical protein
MQYIANTDDERSKIAFWVGLSFYKQNRRLEALSWFEFASKISTKFYGQLAQVFLNRILGYYNPRILHNNPTNHLILSRSTILIRALLRQIRKVSSFLQVRHDPSAFEQLYDYYFLLNNYTERYNLYHCGSAKYFDQNGTSSLPKLLSYPVFVPKVSDNIQNIIRMRTTQTNSDFLKTLLHAIVKEESAFRVDAKSPAGAIGLMQIMPITARQSFQNLVRRKIIDKNSSYNSGNMYDNLILGISHICDLIEKYDSNIILVSAAYNSGEANLDKWIRKLGMPGQHMPSFVWIELIPFLETRNYVKKVVESFVVYSHLLKTEYLQDVLWPLF